jgi:hypothetical protein
MNTKQRNDHMTHNRDPWQQAVDESGGIEGIWIKCSKGRWSFDDCDVATGDDGVKICVVMPTALHGAVLWGEDRTIIDRRLERYEDSAPCGRQLAVGWSPYTQFLAVGADERHRGQLLTFTSSSWGGRRAFHALLGPYVRKGKAEFPVCTLSTRPKRNDPNHNIDPVFSIVGWSARENFAELLPPPAELLEPPKTTLELPKSRTTAADTVDDRIPF